MKGCRTWYVMTTTRRVLAVLRDCPRWLATENAKHFARQVEGGKVIVTDRNPEHRARVTRAAAPKSTRSRRRKPRKPRSGPRARSRRSSRTRTAGKRRRKRRRNPATQLERARGTFRKWHDFDPSEVVHVKGPKKRIPDVLVKLGELLEVVYRSDKWSGRNEDYIHKTRVPRPLLCASPDGRDFFIIGGGMKLTPNGLIN